MTDIYSSIPQATRLLRIDLYDTDGADSAVWKVSIGDDIRFTEGRPDDETWLIVERAVNAFADE